MSDCSRRSILSRLRPLDADPARVGEAMAEGGWAPHFRVDTDDLPGRFRREFEGLRGDLRVCRGVLEAAEAIGTILRDAGYPPMGYSENLADGDLLRLMGEEVLHHSFSYRAEGPTDPGCPARGSLGVGLTGCDALVAGTGSILVSGRSAGPRWLSVLPPTHIVLADVCQLVASVPAAFDGELRAGGRWDWTSLISGPSRTADIEKQLVFGAHGPRVLTLVLIDPSAPV